MIRFMEGILLRKAAEDVARVLSGAGHTVYFVGGCVRDPDSQYIIGGDGDRLDDLQYLVNRMIQRKMEDAPRVKVDCDHYRERNEARLLEKARSLAERVQESGKPMKMPPLNAYHRRLVHNALQSMEGIVTESEEGDSRYKRITIRKG